MLTQYTCAQCGATYERVAGKAGKFCTRSCAMRARAVPVADRFWKHVDRSNPDGCWEWSAARFPKGYGRVQYNGEAVGAHRVAFLLANGYFPPVVRHFVCDNPPCCRPVHLRDGTHLDNARDRDSKGRGARGDRHHTRQRPETVMRGVSNGNARLTEADVRAIRVKYGAGELQRVLAAEYGVRQTAISAIVTRAAWGHVE